MYPTTITIVDELHPIAEMTRSQTTATTITGPSGKLSTPGSDDVEVRDTLPTQQQCISEELLSLTSQWLKATRLDCLGEITIVKSRRLELME
jgi:hypothetical protein